MKASIRNFCRLAFLLSVSGLLSLTQAAEIDLSNAPLASSVSTQVKPNVLFILDDSGSMDWDYMPNDSSNNPLYNNNAVGFRNHLCNRVFYNPDVDYVIPKDYLGTEVYSASQTAFAGAYPNGFYCYQNNCGSSTQSKTNLTSAFKANSSDTGQAAYYWTYLGATAITPSSSACDTLVSDPSDNTLNDVIQICTDNTRRTTTCASGGKTALWKKVLVNSTSGPSASDERQNFANWYSYYRNRMLMMKSSSARAFEDITAAYRIGFLTIHANDGGSVNASKFLKVSDFTSGHRQSWFSKLYAQDGDNATPLRTALSVAGRYFAGKNNAINSGMVPAQADDPMQYSCQQNFAILTTDGYWNSGNGYQMNGTSDMNNQDGVLSELDAHNDAGQKFQVSPRPIYDGATQIYNLRTASNLYRNSTTCPLATVPQQRTVQYQSCASPTGSVVETRTSGNSGSSWSGWTAAAGGTCDSDVVGTSRRACRNGIVTALRTTGNGNSGTPTWTAWTAAPICTDDDSGNSRSECRRQTSYTGCGGAWTNTQCTNTVSTALPYCRSVPGAWADVGACTPAAQDAGGAAIECQVQTINGKMVEYRATTNSTNYTGPGGTGSVSGTPTSTTDAWLPLSGQCYAAGDPALTLPAPNPQTVVGAGPPSPPTGCAAWPCESSSATGGSSNTLADVAQYYYKNDLRTSALGNCTGALGTDVCDNNLVPPGTLTNLESDLADWQHMTTFTMGLGLSGNLNYQSDYKTGAGDFAGLRSGSVTWPIPPSAGDDPRALDDLWHAAVNGRGQYFSASDPNTVVDGLTKALAGVNARVASAAAAATSNLEPVAGDNFAYTAKYLTVKWIGELEAHLIDLSSGVVQTDVVWSAQSKLNSLVGAACDNRNIKLFRAGATDNLVDFKWNTYACDASKAPTGSPVTTLAAAEQGHFEDSQVALLSHYPNMSDATGTNQRAVADDDTLLNFVRGQYGKEGFAVDNDDVNKLYRSREDANGGKVALGDVVNAQPLFVKLPDQNYEDAGYEAFKAAQANRIPMVYLAANDGYLHAFKANGYITVAGVTSLDPEGGKEAWAFVPSITLPNMYKLADANYASNHQYSVDGTPVKADVCDAATSPCNWKTILVAGLNKGGKGYYALDITDPLAPKGLWEFQWNDTCYNATVSSTWGGDCHLGYTYNKPVIAKLEDGTWVAFVTSGYNNFNTPTKTGDGQGYLYVLNAMTGKIIYKISTGVGSNTTPSGLNYISAWANNPTQNATAVRVYGGDTLGNVWRFDVNDNFPPAPDQNGREATRVTTVVDSLGNPQPITTTILLADFDNNRTPILLFGTGRYLGAGDLADTSRQSLWGVVDRAVLSPTTATPVASPRTTLNDVVLTNVGTGVNAFRTADCSDADGNEINGWFADLPDTGERVNIDPKLQLGTFVAASNVPDNNACNVGGYSWLNFVDFKSGCAVSNSDNYSTGVRLSSSLAVGLNIVRLPGGKTVVIATTSAAEQKTVEAPFDVSDPVGKRVSWREISQ